MLHNTLPKTFLAAALVLGVGAGSFGITGAGHAFADSGKGKDGLISVSLRATADSDRDRDDSEFRGRELNKPFTNGLVTAVGSSTVTVRSGETSFTIDASKATVVGKNGATTTLSSIALGDMLFVKGTVTGTTTVSASLISIGRPYKGMSVVKPLGIKGTVTAVSTTTLTVREKGKLITVDASKATITGKSGTTTLSSIKAGDKVFVQGTASGTTTVFATAIAFGEKERDIKPARKNFKEFFKEFIERMKGDRGDRSGKDDDND